MTMVRVLLLIPAMTPEPPSRSTARRFRYASSWLADKGSPMTKRGRSTLTIRDLRAG